MKIVINSNAIKYETNKAYLIKLPKENVLFWISQKCVYPDGYKATIYINEHYDYIGEEKKHKITISGESIIELFQNSEACVAQDKPMYIHHKPEKKEAINVDADDELKR